MEEVLRMRPDETQDEYFYRICNMKDSLGFTWSQMTKLFNDEFGCSCREEKYRKDWASFERIFNANADKLIGDKKYLNEIEEATRNLQKERQKLNTTKVEYNRTLRQESRAELFYENIKDAISVLPKPTFVYTSGVEWEIDKEYVLTIADIQAGAKFSLDCNEYSLDICKDRFDILLNKIKPYIWKNDINKLHVICLGDDIQGILRLTDIKLNETSVVEATVVIANLISCFLNELSVECEIEYYHVPTSNHSQTRNLGSKANELTYEDMEYVIGHYIKDTLRDNNRIVVNLHDGYDYIDIPIFNFNVTAMHGHTIKNLETALKDESMTRRKLLDYIIIGHWHHDRIISGNEHGYHDTELLVCPSFQGTDPYAFNKLGKSSKAACKMFVFDKKYGCIGTEKFILN